MNEAETRAEHIDTALAAAGLGVVEGSQIRHEYSITHRRLEGFGRRGKSIDCRLRAGLGAGSRRTDRRTSLTEVWANHWLSS